MSPRSLDAWLSYLEQLHPNAIDMGLERLALVAERLGLERPARQVITVTGTNGKGSTCAFLAELLAAQGLKVGVYASPHLRRYNERVRIAGREVSDAELCDAFARIDAARGDISLTYFEFGTLATFLIFQAAQLDFAVLEVGLGGRLDAVNLVDADLALVTSIGLDHAEWLGDTRESVAQEKAGIFRAGKPALCGDPAPPANLAACAEALGAPLWLRGRDFGLSEQDDGWAWFGRTADGRALQLDGLSALDLPQENAALALQAYALLGLPWEPAQLDAALQRTCLSGRLERRSLNWHGRSLSVLLDVGHNPHACEYLAQRLQRKPPTGRRRAVFGLLADKDLPGVLQPLLPLIDSWVVAPLPTVRSRPAQALSLALQERGATVAEAASIADALQMQCEAAGEGDEILVFGSFYCVAEALDWLG